MKLYHCSKARSARVLWLLDELQIDYELENLPFDAKALKAPDYLEISPLGRVPVLVDDSTTMFESVAIMQYILRRYGEGRLEPSSSAPEYGQFLQWMHFGEATLMGPISQVLQHVRFLPEELRNPDLAARGRQAFEAYASLLDKTLKDHAYLLGEEFTAADIVIGYALFAANMMDLLLPKHVNLMAYYERLSQRSSFKKATA
jgi:glutathione S-transferase